MATSRKPSKQKVEAMVKTMQKKLQKIQEENSKRGVKQHATSTELLRAIAIAELSGKIDQNRDACRIADAPSVQRNQVCAKAENYRADNAVRSHILSLQLHGIISKNIWYVWGVSHKYAVTNPFTEESEKVFIIKR